MRYENQTNTPSKIRPEYNFYEEMYENNVNTDEIGESLLPNLYVRHYYQQASSLNPRGIFRFKGSAIRGIKE